MDKFGIIERYYDVPARMKAPVMYQGREGVVIGTVGNYVTVEFPNGCERNYHPQNLRWLDDDPIKEVSDEQDPCVGGCFESLFA